MLTTSTAQAKTIPLCSPQLQGNEWKYVKDCLDTGWVSSVGAYVDKFEFVLAKRMKARHAVATASGTAALHTAMLVSGVLPDDEVLVSDLTFIAPANAIRYAGAWPVFIDAEPDYWQMDPERLETFLERRCVWRDGALFNRVTGRRIRAVVPVHILGHPVLMKPIVELARKYELRVIEDATESLGAEYEGQPVGHWGDISCFSFNGNKLITTGGGGMIVTDNDEWAAQARYLTTQAKDEPLEYIHHRIGYNYRLTNIQAAVGVAQMEMLDSFIESKRKIAETYDNCFQSFSALYPMSEAPWARSVYWMYTLLIDAADCGVSARSLLKAFTEAGIQTRPLWQPLHLSPAHAGAEAFGGQVAEDLWRNALSLPCSVGLNFSEQMRVIDCLTSQLRQTPQTNALRLNDTRSRKNSARVTVMKKRTTRV